MTDTISDEDLTAYLDNELPEPDRARIEAALARDAALQDRLAALDVPIAPMTAAFDAVLASAPDPALPAAESRPARLRQSGLAVAAALIGGIAIGAIWAPLTTDPATPDWKTAVADYQVLYVPATLEPGAPAMPAVSQLARLSQSLGRYLSAAETVPALTLRRAQMLGLNDSPLVQIAYQSATGTPFAICITRTDGKAYAPRSEFLSGLAAAHWVDDGYGIIVIGGDNLEQVASLAASLHGKI